MKRLPQKLSAWLRQAARHGAGLIYPPTCALCDADIFEPADSLLLCAECRDSLAGAPHRTCRRCGASTTGAPSGQFDCPMCRGVRFVFSQALALGPYRDDLRQAVLRVKRPGAEPLAASLGRMLVNCQLDRLAGLDVDVVVPIPMHWRRQLAHGTNGPELIAAAIADHLSRRAGRKVPLHWLLTRRRHTLRQTDVTAAQRVENVHGAFAVVERYRGSGVRALLVDDILTTGATANDAARALVEGGAAEVFVAAIARADSPDSHF